MICSHTSLCHRNLQLLWKNALQQELLKISHLLLSFATFCSFRLDYHVHFILPPSIFPSLIVQIYLCLRFLLWRAAIHGVAKSRTRLIDWTELNWRFLMKSPKTRLGSFLAIIEDPVFTSLLAFVGLPRWLKGLIKKKNPLAIQELQETWVWSLGWEDPLEEGTEIHWIFLPGKSRRQRSLAGSESIGSQSQTRQKRL